MRPRRQRELEASLFVGRKKKGEKRKERERNIKKKRG